jgi:hypothetical protein
MHEEHDWRPAMFIVGSRNKHPSIKMQAAVLCPLVVPAQAGMTLWNDLRSSSPVS